MKNAADHKMTASMSTTKTHQTKIENRRMKKIIHDLNNQLTVVVCCASSLSRQNKDKFLEETCDKLLQAARKTTALGNKISKLSQSMEPGKEE